MRENPTSCLNATFFEMLNGRHRTWNDDRLCNTCRKKEEDQGDEPKQ